MSAIAYRLLGVVVWRLGRGYVRRRLRPRRVRVGRALLAGTALVVVAVLARGIT
jgi:hypothetical protein